MGCELFDRLVGACGSTRDRCIYEEMGSCAGPVATLPKEGRVIAESTLDGCQTHRDLLGKEPILPRPVIIQRIVGHE